MLSTIRKFSNTVYAKIFLFIVILPFIFWGMGGVFSGGSQNTLVKINNNKISTNDFMEYVYSLNITEKTISTNIENLIIEKIINQLIGLEILELEIKDKDLIISDYSLSQIIKNDKKFWDTNNKFSRTLYEKYLITNNMSAQMFEETARKENLRNLFYNYLGGGTFSPLFLINNNYNSINKIISVDALNLQTLYKRENDINNLDINNYVNKNKNKLKENFINFNISIIDPLTLVESNDFNELFFEKIDEIEDKILNETSYNEIINEYKLKSYKITEFNKDYNNKIEEFVLNNKIVDEITNANEIKKINLIDNGKNFILININKITKKIPNKESLKFKKKIINLIINENKYNYNKSLLKKINTKAFDKIDFINLANEKNLEIVEIKIKNIDDNSFFKVESLNEIYNLTSNSFTFSIGQNNDTFLINIKNIDKQKINKLNKDYNKYDNIAKTRLRNHILASYNVYLNKKYKVEINQQALERLKNYFK